MSDDPREQEKHNTCWAGKYRGTYWNRIPVYGLRDIVEYYNGTRLAQAARNEMVRRNITNGKIDVTYHAINRYSTRFLQEYITHRFVTPTSVEGLVMYIERMAQNALSDNELIDTTVTDTGSVVKQYKYDNKSWVFVDFDKLKRLVTVTPLV